MTVRLKRNTRTQTRSKRRFAKKKRVGFSFCVLLLSFLFCIETSFVFNTMDASLEFDTLPISPRRIAINITKSATTKVLQLENKGEPKPYVVCTYLRGNTHKYIVGTIILMESVRNYTSRETFNSTITPEIRTAVVCHESVKESTRTILELLGHDVIVVQDVPFDDSSIPSNRFRILMQKYAAFDLVQYQTALFVDSDAFVLKPQDLRGIFGLLDDEHAQITDPNVKPAKINWSKFRQLKISMPDVANTTKNENQNSNNSTIANPKVIMSLDYGPDEFNSGVILYKPSSHLFRDFQDFLISTILPLPEKHRRIMTRSTQRLLQEFLFSPYNHYALYSFCGDTQPFQCRRRGCYCQTHAYPHLLDCNKDKSFLENSTIVHFAGSAIDIDTLCDPNITPFHLERTIQNYFAKSRNEDKSRANANYECQRPMIQTVRDHYSSAIHRIGI